jgi:polyisoprenoid-binding protein YceI
MLVHSSGGTMMAMPRRRGRTDWWMATVLAVLACQPRGAEQGSGVRHSVMAAQVGIAATAPEPAVKLSVLPSGNEVRYRVREQLVNVDLPSDAVGRTTAIAGGLALDSTGAVIESGSEFVITVASLTSDRDRRDGFVRSRLLETDRFPTVTFVPTTVRGVHLPLPASGLGAFTIVGNLTVKGVSRPAVWDARVVFAGNAVSGSATTAFTFKDFGLTQPRVPVLLSVADTIRLEYDFKLGVDK